MTDVKINVRSVKPGMFVSMLDRPWLGTRFPLEGFLVESEEQIVELAALCQTVHVDLGMGEAPDPRLILHESAVESAASREITELRDATYEEQSEFVEEFDAAIPICEKLSVRVGDVMRDLREGKDLDFESLKEGVNAMIDSVMRNPDAFAFLIELRKKDIYAYRHSLATSVWAATFGRHLGLPRPKIEILAQGGLLLDVGKSRLPLSLLNKAGRLDENEMDLMRTHVQLGLDILKTDRKVPAEVVSMVATHHERYDGRGYPKGLKELEIPLYGRIAGIVDTYDALTSPRVYAKPMSPHGAVNVLYEWRDMDFQKELVEQFIQTVGIYPTGTLVELSTGEIGVVISLNGARRLLPRVMILLDARKQPYPEFRELDLRHQADDDEAITIRRGLPPGTHGIDPEDMFL